MSAFVWGRNAVSHSPASFGQAHPVDLPASGGAPLQARDVALGHSHVVVLTNEGTVFSSCSDPQLAHHTGVLGRKKGSPSSFLPVLFPTQEPIVATASGSNHNVAISITGECYEWGMLFKGEDRGIASAGNAAGSGDRTVLSHELPGLSQRLNRNEFLRRVVMRSEAAYLASRDISEVQSEATLSRDPVASPFVSTAGTSSSDGSTPSSPATPTTAEEILRIKVTREVVDVPRLAAGLEGVKIVSVVCGFAHTLALSAEGKLYAGGYNEKGQLGTGDRLPSAFFKPVIVPYEGIKFAGMACGQQHSLAYTTNGELYSTGSGVLGQLGLGHSGDKLKFTRVNIQSPDEGSASKPPPFVVDVACGANHSLCLTSDGDVYSWGHSEYNQQGEHTAVSDLGKGSRYYYIPRRVDGIFAAKKRTTASAAAIVGASEEPLTVVSIAAGGQFNLALMSDGSVVSWGWDAFNCLGRGEIQQDAGSSHVTAATGPFAPRHRAHAGNAKRFQVFARVAGLSGLKVKKIVCGSHFTGACITETEGHPYARDWPKLLAAVPMNKGNPFLEVLSRKKDSRKRVNSAELDGPAVDSKEKEESEGALLEESGAASGAAAAALFRTAAKTNEGAASDGTVVVLPSWDKHGHGDGSGDEDSNSDRWWWATKADVVFVPSSVTTAASSGATDGVGSKTTSGASGAIKPPKAISAFVLEKQSALQALLPSSRASAGAGSTGTTDKKQDSETKRAAADETAAAADGSVLPLPTKAAPGGPGGSMTAPIGAHSAVVLHRLPFLRGAMLAAKKAPGTEVKTSLRGLKPGKTEASSVTAEGGELAEPVVSVTFSEGNSTFEIRFPAYSADPSTATSSRGKGDLLINTQVLSALAVYLYGDRLLPTFPSFRLKALRNFATALGLERLSFLATGNNGGNSDDDAFDSLFLPLETPSFSTSAAATAGGASGSGKISTDGAAASGSVTAALFPAPPLSTFVHDMSSAPRINDSSDRHNNLADVVLAVVEEDDHEAGKKSNGKGTSFLAHSVVLCRSSAFFRKLIGGLGAGGSGGDGASTATGGRSAHHHTLHDVNATAFKHVLRYIYSGDIKPLEKGEEEGDEVADAEAAGNVAFETLVLADRFMLGELASRLTSLLASRVKEEDVPLLLEMARDKNLPALEKVALSMLSTSSTTTPSAPTTVTTATASSR